MTGKVSTWEAGAQVVGVPQPGFELLFAPGTDIERNPDIWFANRLDFAKSDRNNVFLRVVGRLKPGVTLEQARVQVDRIAAELRRRFPIKQTSGLYFQAHGQTRFALLLIGIFACIAALLAAVGLYGVLSAAVRQRTAEIGVRMALGAAPAGVFRLMVGQGLRLSAFGIGVGLIVALGLTRVMESMLVGVQPE